MQLSRSFLPILLITISNALPVWATSAHPNAIPPLLLRGAEPARQVATTHLDLDPSAARLLSARRGRQLVAALPLAGGTTEDFQVERLDVFTAAAQAYEMAAGQRRAIPLPRVSTFVGGSVSSDKHIVLSIVDGTEVWAMVREGHEVTTLIGPTRAPGGATTHALVAGSPMATHDEPPPCGGAVASGLPVPTPAAQKPSPRSARLVSDEILEVEMLIDVGNNLYAGAFGSDTTAAGNYVGHLIGTVSAIYQRDLKIVPRIKTLVIWTDPEPFAADDSLAQLLAYRSYDLENRASEPRDVAHYLDDRGSGGIAYLPGACSAFFAYGVSNLHADVSFPVSSYEWDVNVVAHELGHNLGANHTHCYSPPIDRCWNQENGCYNGVIVPQVGETMSYCHLVASVQTGFHGVIGDLIRGFAESALCLSGKVATCGDGTVDVGEDCDDGNLDEGDCCSSTCMLTGAENPICEDGAFCTINYSCPDTSCLPQPRNCDDANPCTTDYCDEQLDACVNAPRQFGNCDDGLFCTLHDSCQSGTCSGSQSPCGDNDACTSDICNEDNQSCEHMTKAPSATCRIAQVSNLIVKNNQVDAKDSLQWKWSKGALTTHEELLDPIYTTDYSLCVYDENDALVLRTHAPAGGICAGRTCWSGAYNRGFKYKHRTGNPTGTTHLTLKPGVGGRSKITFKGKGVDLSQLGMPLAPTSSLRLQLRNDSDSTCFQSTFSTPFKKNTAAQLSDKQ